MPTTFTPTNVAMKRPMLIQNAQVLAGVEKFSGVINSKVDANDKPTIIGRNPCFGTPFVPVDAICLQDVHQIYEHNDCTEHITWPASYDCWLVIGIYFTINDPRKLLYSRQSLGVLD